MAVDVESSEISSRLVRLESLHELGQLPSRYAMALDARDLDSLVALFVDDVHGGTHGRGREALKAWYDVVLRRFYRSIHLVCGQQVDLIDEEHATGSTYCRAEHEDRDGWYVIAMRYEDEFERRDGVWGFVRRREYPWYSVDITERPGPEFVRWPEGRQLRAAMPQRLPTWRAFWDAGDPMVPQRLSANP